MRPTAPALSSDALRAAQAQSAPFYSLSMAYLVFLFGGTIAEAQQIVQRDDFPRPVWFRGSVGLDRCQGGDVGQPAT